MYLAWLPIVHTVLRWIPCADPENFLRGGDQLPTRGRPKNFTIAKTNILENRGGGGGTGPPIPPPPLDPPWIQTLIIIRLGIVYPGFEQSNTVTDSESRGSILTRGTVLCPWARHINSQKVLVIPRKRVAPSRHDWKIVYWDVQQKRNDTKTDFWRIIYHHMSRVMRKPDFCTRENKAADHLCGHCTDDQRLCFRYTDSTTLFLPKSKISSLLTIFYGSTAWFVSDGKPVFSRRGSYDIICIFYIESYGVDMVWICNKHHE